MSVIKSRTDIVAMQEEVNVWTHEKGWHEDNRSFGDELILIVSELVEALEAYRERGFDAWDSWQPVVNGVKMPKMTQEQLNALQDLTEDIEIPPPRFEGVAMELAGTLVRLLDTCARHGIDLGEFFREEMDYNWTRTHRHGGKRL